MAAPLKFGLDVGIYGQSTTRNTILELTQMAEASGFESIWLADHVIFPATFASEYPYSATGAFPVEAKV